MKNFFVFTAILLSMTLNAASVLKVTIKTGGDDLRGGGNTAHLTINYTDGTTSPEYNLGGGFANGTSVVKSITINRDIDNVNQIKNIVLRHNGSPRAGFPADSYDNWNLDGIKVITVIAGATADIINESSAPLVRFTGERRTHTFVPKVGGGDGLTTSALKVFLTTGSDDLRGGNNAYMTIKYANGTSSKEYTLGGGFGQNSMITKTITLDRTVGAVDLIQSITIRHDGSPRGGQPFDTYDNWDLQGIRVALVFGGAERNIINPTPATPLVRFTGALRTKTWLR